MAEPCARQGDLSAHLGGRLWATFPSRGLSKYGHGAQALHWPPGAGDHTCSVAHVHGLVSILTSWVPLNTGDTEAAAAVVPPSEATGRQEHSGF